MKKVALFVEGQSELIFVQSLLIQIIGYNDLAFKCVKLHGGDFNSVPYDYTNENAKIFFLIVNVQCDENVISTIKEREKGLFKSGFEEVIGLRDLYCEEYCKRSPGCIDKALTKKFIDSKESVIQTMSNPTSIKIFFAIMELESWFLSMYSIFEKLNPLFTLDYLEAKLHIVLNQVNPEEYFFHPSVIIKKIFNSCGWHYDKSQSNINRITSIIELSDIEKASENGRSNSFKVFVEEIQYLYSQS